MVELIEGAKPAHHSDPSKEKVTITLRKDHFFYIAMIGLFAVGLGSGYALGGGGFDLGLGDNNPSPSPSPSPSPAPDARVQVSVDDDPVLGDADAPVTIIEFSDFQCPFCGRHFEQTYPQLLSNYIETGKAKLVFRDFPLSFHPEAEPAAIAAECVDKIDSSKFWEYHDKIFQNQATMSAANYKVWATELGVDGDKFSSCFDSSETKAEVQADTADGSAAGVSGTPTFFIGNDKDGYIRIVGAQPYSVFQQTIDAESA